MLQIPTETIKLLAVMTLANFAFVFGNEADEIYFSDLLIFLAALALILIVQGVVLGLVGWMVRALTSERIAALVCKIVVVLFFTANAYYTSFITFAGPLQTQVLLAAGVGFVFTAILFFRSLQGPTAFLAAAYVCLSFGLYAYTRVVMAYPAQTENTTLTIQKPRNVYLIGMESLHSPKAFRELYAVSTLPHVKWLEEHNFRVLDSAYSADAATLYSYSRIFDFERFVTLDDLTHRTVFRTNNSTFRTFSQSGYSTQFLYRSTLFQVNPYFVTYLFPPMAFYQCDNLPVSYFYFLCRRPVVSFINKMLFTSPPPLGKALQARVDIAATSRKPWFTFYHHAYPFHGNFHYSDGVALRAFPARMRAALPKILSNYQQIIGRILERDPNAVIVTIGDHGAYGMTRGLGPPDRPNDYFTAAEMLEDKYGVMLAVHPADFCRNRIFEGSSTIYLIGSIVKCLNGDDNPTGVDLEKSRTIFLRKCLPADCPSWPFRLGVNPFQ